MDKEGYKDEIDLKQISVLFKQIFQSFLRIIFSIIGFYWKKRILFFFLVVLSLSIGYALDYFLNNKKEFIQQVVIEPEYGSTGFIYNFFETLENDQTYATLRENLGLEKDDFDHLKSITIEPVVVTTDLIKLFSEELDQRDYYKVLEEYTISDLREERFKYFYKRHLITFSFNDKSQNKDLVSKILNYINNNKYYNTKRSLSIAQAKLNIEKSRESLNFIDQYLDSKTKNQFTIDDNSSVVAANNLKIVTLGSLLEQKEELLKSISEKEQLVEMDEGVFTIINFGVRLQTPVSIKKRFLFLIPVLLVGLLSAFYLFLHLKKISKRFAYREI